MWQYAPHYPALVNDEHTSMCVGICRGSDSDSDLLCINQRAVRKQIQYVGDLFNSFLNQIITKLALNKNVPANPI